VAKNQGRNTILAWEDLPRKQHQAVSEHA
jgi:hypothetical protein